MSTRTNARILVAFCFVTFTLVSSAAVAAVPVDFLEGFQPRVMHHVQMLVITESFEVTSKEFRLAAQELDTPDEMTVAFFLSRESGKTVRNVLRRRTRGASWWQVMQDLKVSASWLYMDNLKHLKAITNGNVRNRPRVTFKPMKDARFEDLVGAQVTSEYFEMLPSLVLAARAEGKSFRDIQYAFFHMGRAQNASLRLPGDVTELEATGSSRVQNTRPVPVEDAAQPRRRTGRRPFFE